MEVIASVSGFTSASFVSKSILRPVVDFLEDFWFYGFHSVQYPDFVELFTSEIDLLN